MQFLPRILLRIAILLAIFPLHICVAQNATEEHISFAGASFISDAADIKRRFPRISRAIEFETAEAGNSPFDQLLRKLVTTAKPQFFSLANQDPNFQADYKKGAGKALSFAFSHESLEIQQVDKQFLSIYDISAQAIFFDFAPEKKHLLASYPVRIRHTHVSPNRPDAQEQINIVKSLLFDAAQETSLVNQWVRRIDKASPKGGERLVKVDKAEFDPKALAQIPTYVNQERYALEVAQLLETTISDEWGVPMVPATEGQAIKGKMVQVFANGDAAEFDLPTPSFFVRTLIRDYRKISEPLPNNAGERVAYGVFITSTVSGQAGPVAELKVKNILSVTQPAIVAIRVNDWSQYKTVLSDLLIKTTKQVIAKDRAWITENSATTDAKDQLDAIKSRILRM